MEKEQRVPIEIPISYAKDIAEKFNYDEVIVFAANYNYPSQHVTTYGVTKQACENAGLGGDFIKSHLKWDKGISRYTLKHREEIAAKDKRIEELEKELERRTKLLEYMTKTWFFDDFSVDSLDEQWQEYCKTHNINQ